MYDQISQNKTRSIVIITVFIVVVAGLGFIFGKALDYGYTLFIFATVFAICSSFFSYYFSDKLALSVSGAREVSTQTEQRLFRMVENLSIGAGLTPMPKVYVIEDTAINAFATGRDPKHASVAVTRGALQKLDDMELEGVIAHELSHIRNYDILTMTIAVVLVGIIALVSEWFMRSLWFSGDDNRREGRSGGLMIIFAIIGAILAPLIGQLLQMALSRQREYLADASGALLTRYPDGLAQALEKIQADGQPLRNANTATAHLYIANPFEGVNEKLFNLFSTHPPIEERIKRLRAM
ncbi:M48 family metallopeptidase [candidate division WWE3 bacterium]|nr:M48 family metallopeptidase [candidate division WWE3 bacterium]